MGTDAPAIQEIPEVHPPEILTGTGAREIPAIPEITEIVPEDAPLTIVRNSAP